MPLRTRDFLLYMIAAAFLVVAIVVTIVRDVYPSGTNTATAINSGVSAEEIIYTATIEEKPMLDRAGRLASLRDKISQFKDSFSSENPKPEPVAVAPVETDTTKTVEVLTTELKCPTYQTYAKQWSAQGLSFSVVEGARLLYREVETNSVLSSSSSSTIDTTMSKEVILQLPLQAYATANKNCLQSDVVGIAVDGSLIRNNENKMYSIFDTETLVGYALDGFPIYGQSLEKTDVCGGVIKAGQYRYQLSLEREAVLYCYAGTPVEI